MASVIETEDRKFIGRKLYMKWGKHLYVAIEKVPLGDKKLLEMELNGSEMMLCNLYEDKNTGSIIEENLGAPSDDRTGFELSHIFVNQGFWMTPGEAKDPNFSNIKRGNMI